MAYEKQNFKDGQVLTAEMLNKMEQYFQYCPQCYSGYGQTELLPETTLTLVEEAGGMPLLSKVELVVSESYTVVWNGDEYETIAQEFYDESSGGAATVLGNFGAMMGGESTGEPFVLLYNPDVFGGAGFFGMFMPLDGSANATVKIIGTGEIVHKLEKKYLPVDNTSIENSKFSEGALRTANSKKEDGVYTMGLGAFAEGEMTEASGDYSHAEGLSSKAIGNASHAEGYGTASGNGSHAEGHGVAIGNASHAEGMGEARSAYSHAEGEGTIANCECQHVQGRYNEVDVDGRYAFIIGKGTGHNTQERKNAFTVDWEGNGRFAGSLICENIRMVGKDNAWHTITIGADGNIEITKG